MHSQWSMVMSIMDKNINKAFQYLGKEESGRHFRVFVLELLDDGGRISPMVSARAGWKRRSPRGCTAWWGFQPLSRFLVPPNTVPSSVSEDEAIYRFIVVGCHVPPNIGAASLRALECSCLADAVKALTEPWACTSCRDLYSGWQDWRSFFSFVPTARWRRQTAVQADYAVEMCCSSVLRAPGWPAPALPRQMRQSCA